MDKIIMGWQCPLCKTVYSPLVSSCECSTENTNDNGGEEITHSWPFGKANWLIWGEWKGNHDQRIEYATCSKCGYVHPTVFKSVDNLAKYCPSCKREMSVVES